MSQSSPGERQRRYRERQQKGIQVYSVEIPDNYLESLVHHELISWEDATDKKKVSQAVAEVMKAIWSSTIDEGVTHKRWRLIE